MSTEAAVAAALSAHHPIPQANIEVSGQVGSYRRERLSLRLRATDLPVLEVRTIAPDGHTLWYKNWPSPSRGFKSVVLPPVDGTTMLPGTDFVHIQAGSAVEEQSGASQHLAFDGKSLRLVNIVGHTLASVPAISGANSSAHSAHLAGAQFDPNTGPIPEGEYYFERSDVQFPEEVDGTLVYPSGDSARKWGPFRIRLRPDNRYGRHSFFIHFAMEATTQGCIALDTGHEAFLNYLLWQLQEGKQRRYHLRVAYSDG